MEVVNSAFWIFSSCVKVSKSVFSINFFYKIKKKLMRQHNFVIKLIQNLKILLIKLIYLFSSQKIITNSRFSSFYTYKI